MPGRGERPGQPHRAALLEAAPPVEAAGRGVVVAGAGLHHLGALRARVRAFLADAPGRGRVSTQEWFSRLARAGYVAPHWPSPWGIDASPAEQVVVDEELRAAGAHRPENPIALGWAGPTLLVAGTEEQQQRFLPGMLDGSETWCQLFSEPEAGSDLASLRTRAVLDGDEWVIHGEKIWTSLAHVARYGILLARTDSDLPKRDGISYFVVDMRSPGIEVRPIRQMNGSSDFNSVVLDGVRIPHADLVGAPGDGWRLARVTLGNERVALSGEGALWGRGPTATDLVAAVAAGGRPLGAIMRQRLAGVYAESEVLRFLRWRSSPGLHRPAPIWAPPPRPSSTTRCGPTRELSRRRSPSSATGRHLR